MVDWLCTLAQVREEIKAEAGDTADDPWIIRNIPIVSQRLNVMTRTRFVPWKEEYKYDAFGPQIDDVYRYLQLGRPLLHPIDVVDALGQHLVEGVNYITVPQDNPAFQLQRTDVIYGWSYGIGFGVAFWFAPIQFQNAIHVTAIWGYRTLYPLEGWVDSNQTLDGSINSTARTFVVQDVNGVDGMAQTPAISVGNVLQLTDNSVDPATYEWMQVIAVDS